MKFPCAGCGGILRFRTEAELEQHMALVHPSLLAKEPGTGGAHKYVDGQMPTVPAGARSTKEVPVATKPRSANPDNCRLCARLAPERCKRHGGAPRSTSSMGRKQRQALTQKATVACSACHRADGTHTANCRSKNGQANGARAAGAKAIAHKGRDMLKAAIAQIEKDIRTELTLLEKARAFGKEFGG